MSRHTKIKVEEVMDSYCGVCFVSFQKKTPKKLDEGLQILVCKKCHCNVHSCCYDFEPNYTYVNDQIRQFVCQKCSITHSKHKQCIVCNGSEGVLKRIGDNELIHVFCALTHPQIDVISYYPEIKFRKTEFFEVNKLICELCKTPNADNKCAQQSCGKPVHTYCAQSKYKRSQQQGEEAYWKFFLHVGDNNMFDFRDDPINYSWVVQDTDSSIKSIEKYDVAKPNKEEIRQKIFEEYYQEAGKIRKNSRRLRRGGFAYVMCQKHGVQFFCSCMRGQGVGDMVQCDCCFQWYHQICVKYEPKNENENYICKQCIDFYDTKKKMVDEIRHKKSEGFQIKAEIPHKSSLMDMMWVLRVIDNRIGGGGISSKLLKLASKIPIKSSRLDMIIKNQNRNQLAHMTQQFLKEYLRSQLKDLQPLPVLAIDDQHKPITLYENIEHNRKIKEYVNFARSFTHSNRLPDIYQHIQNELSFKEKAQSQDYEKIIELAKSKEKYPEVEVLRAKAQAYSYMETLKKVNSGEVISFSDFQETYLKVQSNPSIPQYLIASFLQRYSQTEKLVQQIKEAIINDPNNTQFIEQKIKDLEQEKIAYPEIYNQYKEQVKIIADLYLLYLKQTGKPIRVNISLQEKVKEMQSETLLKGSKQLSEVFKLRLAKPNFEPLVINCSKELISEYTAIAIQFQLENAIKQNNLSIQRVLQLTKNLPSEKICRLKQDVKNIIQIVQKIKADTDKNLANDLTNLDQFGSISQAIQQIKIILSEVEKLPIKPNNKSPSATITKLTQRQDLLQNLMVMCTQMQLKNNPLTIDKKVLSLLPKTNNLVRNYLVLKKQQETLMQKVNKLFAKSNEKIEILKKQTKKMRKDQIILNAQKPSISDATQLIQTLSRSKIDFQKQIDNLTNCINKNLQLAATAKKYYENKNYDTAVQEELNNSRKEIDQIRKKLLFQAQLNLSTQLNDLYHLQIINRMKTLLLANSADLEKAQKVLKFAQEQGLTHVLYYQTLKANYDRQSQSKEQMTLLKSFQQLLNDQPVHSYDPLFHKLQTLRKSLPLYASNHQKNVDSEIQALIEKNKKLNLKVQELLKKQAKKEQFQQAKNIFLDALRNPFLIENLDLLSSHLHSFQQLHTKWKNSPKPENSFSTFFQEYDNLIFTSEDIEQYRQNLKLNEEGLDQLQYYLKSQNKQTVIEKVQEIMENLEQHSVDLTVAEQAKIKYIQFWLEIVQLYQQKGEGFIPYEKLKRLLQDSYNILQNILRRNGDAECLRTPIQKLEAIMQKILDAFKSKGQQELLTVEGYIGVQDLAYEFPTYQELLKQIIIFHPYKDLSKFRYSNLFQARQREQPHIKRSRPQIEQNQAQQEPSRKSPEKIKKKEQDSPEQPFSNIVNESQRKRIKQILLKNMKKNPELNQCQQYVRIIENQIFGEYHNNILKYLEVSDQLEQLFIKLLNCPRISNKLYKKKFQFQFLKLLVNSIQSIKQFEEMMINKSKPSEEKKQKVQEEKPKKVELPPVIAPKPKPMSVIQMIAFGKIDENQRKDLRKQMKAVREMSRHSRDHRNKKKKHHHKKHHHHHRSISRSDSSESSLDANAKFSSNQQQEQILPSYIQRQYSNTQMSSEYTNQMKTPLEMTPTPHDMMWRNPSDTGYYSMIQPAQQNQPLMFDPQLEQGAQTMYFPMGSVLKLKEVELEMYSKKKQLINFKSYMLTDEDHKKILLELVDPDFYKISLRREKNDQEIIQYLNKPSRKKYKYLYGWFQAVKQQDNEYIKDFANDCFDKKKIFGIQSDQIKMHIMSIKQFLQINKFHSAPSKVTSSQASETLKDNRVVFVLQYPAEKMFQLKSTFKNFENVSKIEDYFQVSIPSLGREQYDVADRILSGTTNEISIKPLQTSSILPMQTSQEIKPKTVEFQGWGTPQQTLPYIQPLDNYPGISLSHQNSITDIKKIFTSGHASFSPILTDQQDNTHFENIERQEKNQIKAREVDKDFASNILNQITQLSSKKAFPSTTQVPQQQNPSYGGYSRYSQPQAQQKWSGNYGSQQVYQSGYQPRTGSVYNPMNPMNPMNPINPMNPMNPMNPGQKYNMPIRNPMNFRPPINNPMQYNRGQQQHYNSQYQPMYQGHQQYQQQQQYNQQHGQGKQPYGQSQQQRYPPPPPSYDRNKYQ